MNQTVRQFIILLLRIYQVTLSPDHGPLRRLFPAGVCRYHPTCSVYCLQSVKISGWRGLIACLKRVVSCHPFSPGGYDPPRS